MRALLLFVLVLFAAAAAQAQAPEGRLKKIAESKAISIAYRADAVPFSYVNDKGQPDGFAIDLCKRVVNSIERQLNAPGLKVNWVPVTVQTRFEAVAKGRADMECGSSTMTLARMKEVDFSSITFVESTGLLVKADSGLRSLSDMSGKKIAVVAGTTNEGAINLQLKRRQMNASVLPFKSRDEAFAAFEEGKADAFASDKLLLVGTQFKDAQSFRMLPDDLSVEPYAIALPHGDWQMRLAVNTALAELYRTGAVLKIFDQWFGRLGLRPGLLLGAAYTLGALAD